MTFRTINPATGEVLKDFALQSDEEVLAALSTADRRHREDWKFRPVAERAAIVGRAAQILRDKRDEYVTYPTLEMGKVTRFGYQEIDLVADILDYYATNGERLLAPQSLPGEPGATVVAEPVGVLLAIEPWNILPRADDHHRHRRGQSAVPARGFRAGAVLLRRRHRGRGCRSGQRHEVRLGGYVFDADVEHAKEVASRIESGMVYINSCFADSPGLPFGGVKNSGFGRELSELGLGEFLNRKLIRVTRSD